MITRLQVKQICATRHETLIEDVKRDLFEMKSDLALTPQLALVFSTPNFVDDHFFNELRRMMTSLFGEAGVPPLLGCTTPYPINAREGYVTSGVVVTILAARSEHLEAFVGLGPAVFEGHQSAVRTAIGEISRSAQDDEIIKRSNGFLLGVLPGFKNQSNDETVIKNIDDILLHAIADELKAPITFFGGTSGGKYQESDTEQFYNYGVYRDSLVIALVKTELTYSANYAYGFQPGKETFKIDQLQGGAEVGHILEKINSKDAWPSIKSFASFESSDKLVLSIGDPINGYHFVRPFPVNGESGNAYIPRMVSNHSYLHPAVAKREDLLKAAGDVAVEIMRSVQVIDPKIVLINACVGRTDLFDQDEKYVKDEIEKFRGVFNSSDRLTIAGFYGYGEHCGMLTRHEGVYHNLAISALALGNNLSTTGALLDKLSILGRITPELQFLDDEKKIARRVLESLNEAGYAGGMISLIDESKPRCIRAAYALNAEGVNWNRWELIMKDTVREMPSGDLLALIARRTIPSPTIIPVSSNDHRCDQNAVSKGEIQGQIVFRLAATDDSDGVMSEMLNECGGDESDHEETLGTLQIGIPLKYHLTTAEVEALSQFGRVAAQCIANRRRLRGLRNQIDKLYLVSQETGYGEKIDQLLEEILKAATDSTNADYASLRLADFGKGKEQLYLRSIYPNDEEILSLSMRNRTYPLELIEDKPSIATWVFATSTSYRFPMDESENIASMNEGQPSDLSVPIRVGDKIIGVLSVYSRMKSFSRVDEDRLTSFVQTIATMIVLANESLRSHAFLSISSVFLRPHDISAGIDGWQSDLQETVQIISQSLRCDECSIFIIHKRSFNSLMLHATTSEKLKDQIGVAVYEMGEGLTGGVALLKQPLRLSAIGNDKEIRDAYPAFWSESVRWRNKYCEFKEERKNLNDCEYLGVPILKKDMTGNHGPENSPGDLLGVIRCVGKKGIDNFTDDDENLLISIAEWLALGLIHSDMLSRAQFSDQLLRHQLKNPLTEVDFKLETFLNSRPPYDLDIIKECRIRLSRTLRLIQGLRVLAQVDNIRSLKIEIGEFLIDRLVKKSILRAQEMIKVEYPHKPQIATSANGLSFTHIGYEVFIEEALVNLISNAMKVSPPDHPIEIKWAIRSIHDRVPPGTCVVERGKPRTISYWREAWPVFQRPSHAEKKIIVISVSDQGPGIKLEQLEVIFDPFTTFHKNDDVKGFGLGLGLGLPIVQATMKAHEGVVTILSKIDGGSEFSLVFPMEI